MSYYRMDDGGYAMVDPGTPLWWNAPVPSWGSNPYAAGPSRVGIGNPAETPVLAFPQASAGLGCPGCGPGVGQDPTAAQKYLTVGWGTVALAAAGSLLVGLLIGHYAGKRSKPKRMRRNPCGRRTTTPRRRYAANVRWSTRYKNQMPDSHFMYVSPGGRRVRTTRGTWSPVS